MKSSIYAGHIAHSRFIPKEHSFKYPFFMWFLDLDRVEHLENLGIWFSSRRWALSRYRRADYLGDSEISHGNAVRKRLAELTGCEVVGKVFGLMNMSSLGLYFSPVNFYYGFDESGEMSHFMAEVSNIPWNERHHYGHYVGNHQNRPTHRKAFHVSPFNPTDQTYKWIIEPPDENIAVNLGVHDERGHIFEASLRLKREPFSLQMARKQIVRKPVLTASVVAGIYWQALKIYLKKIPYIAYEKEKA